MISKYNFWSLLSVFPYPPISGFVTRTPQLGFLHPTRDHTISDFGDISWTGLIFGTLFKSSTTGLPFVSKLREIKFHIINDSIFWFVYLISVVLPQCDILSVKSSRYLIKISRWNYTGHVISFYKLYFTNFDSLLISNSVILNYLVLVSYYKK